MLYILDTANLEQIKRAFDLYPMSGVTTNPRIISKENRNFLDILKEIKKTLFIIIGSFLTIRIIGTSDDSCFKPYMIIV